MNPLVKTPYFLLAGILGFGSACWLWLPMSEWSRAPRPIIFGVVFAQTVPLLVTLYVRKRVRSRWGSVGGGVLAFGVPFLAVFVFTAAWRECESIRRSAEELEPFRLSVAHVATRDPLRGAFGSERDPNSSSEVSSLRPGDECEAKVFVRPMVESRGTGKFARDVCVASCEVQLHCRGGAAVEMQRAERCDITPSPLAINGGGWAGSLWLSFSTAEGTYVLGTHPMQDHIAGGFLKSSVVSFRERTP